MNSENVNYVHQSGMIVLPDKDKIQLVVACHPQAKPEDEWVNEVVCRFKGLQKVACDGAS